MRRLALHQELYLFAHDPSGAPAIHLPSLGVGLLASLINMGALIAFLVLHLCVIVHYVIRRRSRNLWAHLVVPIGGLAILTYVVINANILAQTVGLVWLAIGVLVLVGLYAAGRKPVLALPGEAT